MLLGLRALDLSSIVHPLWAVCWLVGVTGVCPPTHCSVSVKISEVRTQLAWTWLACALTLKLSQHKWLFGNIDKWRPGATPTAPLYFSLGRAYLSCVNITACLYSNKFCFKRSPVKIWKLFISCKCKESNLVHGSTFMKHLTQHLLAF